MVRKQLKETRKIQLKRFKIRAKVRFLLILRKFFFYYYVEAVCIHVSLYLPYFHLSVRRSLKKAGLVLRIPGELSFIYHL